MARRILLILVAVLVAGTVVRNAVVEAFAERQPAIATQVWPSHPDVAVSAGFARIGQAAASGRAPVPAVLNQVAEAARRAPLAVEPFLVRGVSAQAAGDSKTAERAFREARRRDPRSRAARYFLAELLFRTGRIGDGLEEIASLSRLVPTAGGRISQLLARYARTPGAASQLDDLFRRQPAMRPAILGELAKDAVNADLVLALADGGQSDGDQAWKGLLVQGLVESGQYEKARRTWSRLSGVTSTGPVFDADFRGSAAPPPFNWTFASGGSGFAEPENGTLHAIYYGRDPVVLAAQLLTLRSGPHRLAMHVTGGSGAAESLAWRISCVPSQAVIGELHLEVGRLASEVTIPADCAAQRMELAGTPRDVPSQVDVRITDLRLTPMQPR